MCFSSVNDDFLPQDPRPTHTTSTVLGLTMSAPLYTSMPPPPRRHPLAAAPNHYAVNQQPRHAPPPAPGTPPPKQQEQPKQPASPPLPRQNAKVTPPSPPKIITDKSRSLEFMRVGMLGEVCTHSSPFHPLLFSLLSRWCLSMLAWVATTASSGSSDRTLWGRWFIGLLTPCCYAS